MNPASSHLPDSSLISPVAKVSVLEAADFDRGDAIEVQSSALVKPSSGLASPKGKFASFLAPLTQDKFKEVVHDVEDKLQIVNQTLSMLDMQGFDTILEEMLTSITAKTGELLNADRTTIYLLDEEKHELYTTIASSNGGRAIEIRFPADQGIAGEVATFKRPVNIPYDFFDDPRSAQAKIQYKKTGYRTYTMLTLPLLTDEGALVAVVQLINKLRSKRDRSEHRAINGSLPLADRIHSEGFTAYDEQLFKEFAPSIRLILESSRSFYIATQKQRAANALIKATQSLSQSSLDLDDTLKRVMDEAKQLMNADRSTLWLIDRDRNEIWTRIALSADTYKELRLPIGVGFAGQVAATGEVINLAFDLYDHEGAETAKQTDKANGYRTCSLLCMPVCNADGELIGVTQLVNKTKQGEFFAYDPQTWPDAPEQWKSSFNRSDQEFMETFNIQAGVALQNARLFETVKQQEQMQRDILRSLSNGVISTDKEGTIIAANDSAKKLLGLNGDDLIEGRAIADLITIEKGNFAAWCRIALEARNQNQYYPDQTLQPVRGEEQHSINLSINTIADANDSQKVSGALIVMDDISDEKRLKSTMYRYMTQELAEQLLENPDAAKMGGDRKEVSVLFSDIRSYTTLTETLKAEEVVEMLNQYFESMVEAVFMHKGILDKYIGDAIMAVFGSPLPLDDHEWMAVKTAVEMRRRLAIFNTQRAARNQQVINIGIGINSDTVISGNIGCSKRMEFTAIGDGVNLGSRLESASKIYGTDIVISESTYRPCADRVWARELDFITVKGKTRPVAVYELVGLKTDAIADQKQAVIEHYHKAREHYLNRKFAFAVAEFATVLEIDHHDKAAALHMERCQHWLKNPPTDEWDGAWVLTEK
ncbi:adenylate/guanylate cyclase domain-containing protein [Myxacorys almedinensis]|uniref:GAF domain-containing protein n=1 Tax=Myxacorys almedinensis A TaxID=2690445 RepID=A0A8J7Z326_9CYAN|nr:adenylate/guanylate cyclase domain-containing protein [Myxacorys almedinensis]NDJ16931.1 GAF domain-containing protein [Myxacorys almedinensis A]